MATLGPGQFFGEISLLTGGPATASVVPAADTVLLLLPREVFEEVVETYPKVMGVLRAVARDRHRELRALESMWKELSPADTAVL